MFKKKLSVVLVAMAVAGLACAQTASETADQSAGNTGLDVPQAQPGQCQALVIVPAQFKQRTEQVVVKEAAKTYKIIPAEYKEVEQQVMIKPAGDSLKVIPATYKTVEKQIEISPKGENKEVIAPKYGEVVDKLVAKPAYMAAATQGSARTFNSTGEALRLAEVPAENQSLKKQVVQEPAKVTTTPVDAQYVTVKIEVVDQPIRVEKVPYDAQYKTVKVKQLVTPAQQVEEDIPAEYAQVKVFDKVSDAAMRWEPVLCSSGEVNRETVKEVQAALNKLGYKTGVPDGQLGPSSLKALEAYQKENNLATGGITLETLKSLGISQ